jgi:PAS domain S-box-containing protein
VILEVTIFPLRDASGQIAHAVIQHVDVTERRRAEESLRQSQERYKALFDRSLDGVYVHDFAGHFLDANPAALGMLGYTVAEMRSLSLADLLPEDQLPLALATLTELGQSGAQKEPTVYWMRRKDGAHIWVETNASVIYQGGQPAAAQGIARDITEHIRTEETLRLQRDLATRLNTTTDMQQALDWTLEAVCELPRADGAGVFLLNAEDGSLNLAAHRGLSAAFVQAVARYGPDAPETQMTLAGQPLWFNHAQLEADPLGARLQNEGLRAAAAMPILCAGRTVALLNLASRSGDDFPADTRAAIVDIAAQVGATITRIQAQATQRESETRFRTLVEQLPGAVYTARLDESGGTIYVSPQIEKLTGYTPEEYLANPRTWRELIHPDDRKRVIESYERSRIHSEPFQAEYRLVARDGRVVWIRDEGAVVRDAAGQQIGRAHV